MSQEELSGEQSVPTAPGLDEIPGNTVIGGPSAPAQPGPGVFELPLATLYDLTLPIAIELGRTSMTVQEVLGLGRGSVIELDRLAGEPVDIIVGDRRFAEGEVVVLGENFGVRITRILPNISTSEAA